MSWKNYKEDPPIRWTITDICTLVALNLPNNADDTMIRTAINDEIDARDKDGNRVPQDYSQPRAVGRVRRWLDMQSKWEGAR
tara:strand:- start:1032 stop:1277 length:246 start_codon:yes stop_codon:yes gene_type:complete